MHHIPLLFPRLIDPLDTFGYLRCNIVITLVFDRLCTDKFTANSKCCRACLIHLLILALVASTPPVRMINKDANLPE
jgi:hypothetical protein